MTDRKVTSDAIITVNTNQEITVNTNREIMAVTEVITVLSAAMVMVDIVTAAIITEASIKIRTKILL